MIERILLLMKEQNLTPSQFADMIGVQRSGMSHLISGRNKPSLEFVLKVLQRFPHVAPEWLLYGKGTPGRSVETTGGLKASSPVSLVNSAATLFDDTFANELASPSPEKDKGVMDTDVPGKPGKEAAGKIRPALTEKPREERAPLPVNDRKGEKDYPAVEKIVIFYTNRTFREYTPKD